MAGEKNTSGSANELLDHIIGKMGLKNDAALSRFLEVAPPVVSKMRNINLPFGAAHIVRLHEKTDWPIAYIKQYLPQEKKSVTATK